MSVAAVHGIHRPRRGPELLVQHCISLAHLQEQRVPARRRLDRRVGPGLARLLVFALSGDHAPRRPPGRRRSLAP